MPCTYVSMLKKRFKKMFFTFYGKNVITLLSTKKLEYNKPESTEVNCQLFSLFFTVGAQCFHCFHSRTVKKNAKIRVGAPFRLF
jgi:hypothetical protein